MKLVILLPVIDDLRYLNRALPTMDFSLWYHMLSYLQHFSHKGKSLFWQAIGPSRSDEISTASRVLLPILFASENFRKVVYYNSYTVILRPDGRKVGHGQEG
jgi:hypothetical protein